MTDTWTIGTNLGWSYNSTSGQDEQTVDPLFTTAARLAESGTQATESEAGGRTVLETRRELHIPWDSPAVPPNAVAECTATGPLSDPTLIGTIVRLRGSAPTSQTTARRLEVVEVLT